MYQDIYVLLTPCVMYLNGLFTTTDALKDYEYICVLCRIGIGIMIWGFYLLIRFWASIHMNDVTQFC